MKKVLALVGPTASGKTKLAIQAAKKLNGEIISADSRQVYKYIPISTSQPSKEDLKEIKHYFIAEHSPEKEFNAGEFGTRGREIIADIFSRRKQPVVAGGSGLYIRSLIDGFFEEKIESPEIRNMLYEKLNSKGKEYLYNELMQVDVISAETMIPQNFRRVIRALEVYYVTGKQMSSHQEIKMKIDFKTVQIGLMFDRKQLYNRINERVDNMLDNGLIDEVKNLVKKNIDYNKHYSLNTVGIKEVFMYLEGKYDYESMVKYMKQNSRRYAKRQMTWFRKDKRINWIDVNEESRESDLVDEIIKIFNEN